MFDDMVQKLMHDPQNAIKLAKLVQKLQNRPLRLATMCSGTESPLLALDMLQKSIQQACQEHPDVFNNVDPATVFQLEHAFSCEIEPFKQAYIERNFPPPLLFRDIRELGQEEAYTAYGALHKVPNTPGDVDVVCVILCFWRCCKTVLHNKLTNFLACHQTPAGCGHFVRRLLQLEQ